MARFALLGDSYVTRLGRFCEWDLKVPVEVKFFGKGGMRADSIPRSFLQELIAYHPDAVIINLGGNDIACNSSPGAITDSIMRIATELSESGVKAVYFVEIMPRGNFSKSPNLTAEAFDSQRKAINKKLKKKAVDNFVVLRKVKFPSDYHSDLVHFGDSGLRKFFMALRGVICSHK